MADPTSADRSRLQPLPRIPPSDRERLGAPIPTSLTSFVGRAREIAEVGALLRDGARLVTLIGPGGVGKTRLALAIAAAADEHFPDGSTFVALASLSDPALVVPTIAQAFGMREGGDRHLDARLAALLGERRLLLALDNLEHLLAAVPQLADLLVACPGLKILATSRSVLRLSGEQVYPVPPLGLPDAARPLSPAELAEHGAVALFVQRARAADPGFALTAENLATVVEIVRRLDGLPLAIELAAARVRSLTPAALLKRLSDRLRLLTGGARDLPERQRTMRDAVAWSYDLLDPAEQACFRRLAVFAGGCTAEAAEAVAEGEGDSPDGLYSVLDLVGSLVDQSLLRRTVEPDGEPRYLMLETVGEYALDRLEASGEADAIRQRHAEYFVGLAEAAGPFLQWQRDTGASMRLLSAELDNLRAALAWATERDARATFLRLAAALQHYWFLSGRLVEGWVWLDRAVAVCDAAPIALRASVMREAGWLARHLGDLDRAEVLGQEALALSRQHGDTLAVVHALTALGWVAEERGQFARARAFHEEALELGRRLEDPGWTGWSTLNVGMQSSFLGDIETTERLLEEALALFTREGYQFGAAYVRTELAEIALARGDVALAATLWQERLGMAWDAAGLRQGLALLAEISDRSGEAAQAARLMGMAEVHSERLGTPLWSRQSRHLRNMAAARAVLGEAAFVAAWADGRLLSADEARSEAIRLIETIKDGAATAATARVSSHGLTPREVEILRLVADGRSDREIAETLYIGVGTVRTHLTNAFGKLEVGSRTAAVATARQLGIV